MPRSAAVVAVLPGLLLLGGCVTTPAPQPASQLIVQSPAPQAVIIPAPPPPNAELVPPPPQGAGTVVWQPGHWRYTGIAGSEWVWVRGQYTPPPYGMSTWQPGRWTQSPSGGWLWVEGHWS